MINDSLGGREGRQAGGLPKCRGSFGWPFCFGRFAPVAVGVHLQDDRVMHEAVDRGDGHACPKRRLGTGSGKIASHAPTG
jgi:hypothetical protein